MLDGKAYKALMSNDTDPDLLPRLRDPALLNAFAALADDLRTVMGQIAWGKDADRLELNPSRTQYKERKAPAHKQWAQPV